MLGLKHLTVGHCSDSTVQQIRSYFRSDMFITVSLGLYVGLTLTSSFLIIIYSRNTFLYDAAWYHHAISGPECQVMFFHRISVFNFHPAAYPTHQTFLRLTSMLK
jgi:hypothetical protein